MHTSFTRVVLRVRAKSASCSGPTTRFLRPRLSPLAHTPAATVVVLSRTGVRPPAAAVTTALALPHEKPHEPLLRLLPHGEARGADGLAPVLAPGAALAPLLRSPVKAGGSVIANRVSIPLTQRTETPLIPERITHATATLPRRTSARARRCYPRRSALPNSDWQKVRTSSKAYPLC
jgi:hypothetical protein